MQDVVKVVRLDTVEICAAVLMKEMKCRKIRRAEQRPTLLRVDAAGPEEDGVDTVHLVPCLEKSAAKAAADEPGSAGDQDLFHSAPLRGRKLVLSSLLSAYAIVTCTPGKSNMIRSKKIRCGEKGAKEVGLSKPLI
jgi:hypothetical protein